MKTCTLCKVAKPIDAFWRERNKKHGRSARCKQCKAAIYRKYRKERGYDKARYWNNPGAERERHLKRKYGISQADYQRMLAAQGGGCAICGRTQEKALDVDHDHATGFVRGLLCTNCNRMIGHAADSPERLEAAAKYLRSSPR